jgi:hypothetical protein
LAKMAVSDANRAESRAQIIHETGGNSDMANISINLRRTPQVSH